MHSIKKIIARILLIAFVLWSFGKLVRFVYEPAKAEYQYTSRELASYEGEIDTLFCGTSLAHRAFSPQLWEETMGGCSFNLATAGQPLESTYAYMKQEIEKNPVERVFLGVSANVLKKEKISVMGQQRVYDCLDDPFSKMTYLIRNVDVDKWLYLAYYPVREEKFFHRNDIKKNVAYKISQDFKNNVNPNSSYMGKGYVVAKKSYEMENITHIDKKDGVWNPNNINKKEEDYLVKIIEFCKENQIELILVNLPVTGRQIEKKGNVDEIYQYFNKLAQEHEVIYWDFFRYKDLKETFTNDKFKDIRHLNKVGSEDLNKIVLEIYREYKEDGDVSDYFLDTCPYYL